NVEVVYGPAANGRLILALVYPTPDRKQSCLAELDPLSSLHATRTACALGLRPGTAASRSPDGHWFAVSAANGRIAVYDLTRVFEHPEATTTWTADSPGTWIDADTMLASVSGRQERFRVGQATPEPLDVPSNGPDGPPVVVPKV